MIRIVEFGKFRGVDSVILKDSDGELETAFIVGKESAKAMQILFDRLADYEAGGVKLHFKRSGYEV